MLFIVNFPLFTIVLSLFSGALCFMLPGKAARRYTMCYEAFLTVLCLWILQYTYLNGAFTYVMGEFPAPWGNEIRAGVLEATTALIFMIIMLTAVFCGYRFIEKDLDLSKENLYYALLNLMTAALLSMIWTNDLFTGYVFLEILTLTSCGLLIVREIGRTTLAAIRYMILNLLGSGLFLLGVVLLYDLSGHLLMVPIQKVIRELAADPNTLPVLTISTAILTIGLSIKSGLFPFHFWMPDTYGWATPTSASVLSSLVSKAYLFLLFKIYLRAIGIDVLRRTPILKILFILGICGMVIGSVSAMRASTINQMVAFSSAAQIGYIYMGIGLGTFAGFNAALFQVFAHAATKSLLFLTTPCLAEVSGDSLKFRALQGSARRDNLAGFFFTAGSLSMIGIPIFAGFAAKLMFGQAAIMTAAPYKILMVMIALAVSSVLNALYFIRTLIRIYSDPTDDMESPWKNRFHVDKSRVGYVVAGLILTAGNIFLGMFSWVVSDLIYRGLGMFL